MKKDIKTGLDRLSKKLREANFNVYKFENKKWWGRKNGTASHEEIDNWDKISREWNEERSVIKRDIDLFIQSKYIKPTKYFDKDSDSQVIFTAIPISSMIDMLIIEKIKVADFKKKRNVMAVEKAQKKIKALDLLIRDSFDQITIEGVYLTTQEVRTF
jgi:hypothetical protein